MNEFKWLVLYTKPRAEKKLAKELDAIGIETYCPCYKTLRQWSDRKKMVTVPYFTSYLFVKTNFKFRNRVLRRLSAIGFVKWLGKPVIIRESEMNSLKQFLKEYPSSQPERLVNPGDTIEMTNGPFKNQKGIIIKVNHNKVVLRLDQIGYQLVTDRSMSSFILS